MKTSVIMNRKMGQFDVLQRTSDGYFDANDLLYQWRKSHPTFKDTFNDFLAQNKVRSFITELENELGNNSIPHNWGLADLLSVTKIKGRNTKHGRTKDQIWCHPYLYIKLAMWINPKFELQVIKFVYDELIKNRHLAGDNYNVLTAALATLPDIDYRQIAMAIQWIVFNKTGKNLRQSATQEQLHEISEIEHSLAFSINMGMINNNQELITLLRKMYNKKYQKF